MRHPIYIPSKGRAEKPLTARMFDGAGIPYTMVVEPSQEEAYAEWRERGMLHVLPKDRMGLVYARNAIKDLSISRGEERHWQFDDDIRETVQIHKGYRLKCDPKIAISACEDFVERYENVALASLNSEFFVPCNGAMWTQYPPFFLNQRCYTCFLMLNSLPNRWRNRYNEDTDMTLQVLSDGWCTVLLNAFCIKTEGTANNSTGKDGKGLKGGGGQAEVYADDGRLKMSRDLERMWPGVVKTIRKYSRPQHKVAGQWMRFDTKLIPKAGADNSPKRYGAKLVARKEPQSAEMRRLLEEANDG